MLDPIPVADDIALFIKSLRRPPGERITDDILREMWEGIVTRLYNDIKANAVVNSTGAGFVTAGIATGNPVATTDVGTIS
jgi:hypothetical protein